MATRPWRAVEAEEALAGQRLTQESGLAAGRLALQGASPGKFNGFKVELCARTVADALLIAAKGERA